MSGGAFDCVYLQHKNVDELFESLYVLEKLIKFCREHDKQEIANELDRFFLDIKSMKEAMEVRFERVRDLIGSVDYVAAGDSSWKLAEESLNKLLKEKEE